MMFFGKHYIFSKAVLMIETYLIWILHFMGGIKKHIKNLSSPVTLPPGQLVPGMIDDEYQCYIVESGLAVVYINEHTRPLMVLTDAQVVGLSHLIYPYGDFTLKIIHSSVVYSLPASTLLPVINQKDLWPEVAYLLAQEFYALSYHLQRTKKSQIEDLVSQALRMLQHESEEVRLTHTVNDYLCHITGLSPSTIKRNLENLKKQGYIEIQNGLLLRCDIR